MLLSKTPPTSERFLRGAKFYQLLDNFHFFFFNVTQSLNCWIIFSLFFFKCNIVLSETLEKGKCWPIVSSTCWKFSTSFYFSMEHVAPQSLFHCHYSPPFCHISEQNCCQLVSSGKTFFEHFEHFRAVSIWFGLLAKTFFEHWDFKLSPNNPVVSSYLVTLPSRYSFGKLTKNFLLCKVVFCEKLSSNFLY